MRVGFDMHYAQSPLAQAGIGQYSFHHINRLAAHSEVQAFYFQPRFDTLSKEAYVQALKQFITQNSIDVYHLPSPMTVQYPEVFTSGDLPPVRLVATVYDIIPMRLPHLYLTNDLGRQMYERHVDVLRSADFLVSISDFTKRDLVAAGFDEARIVTIGGGADPGFFRMKSASLASLSNRFPTKSPFVLAFAPMDIRKNSENVVRAFGAAMRRMKTSHRLVFVGHVTNEAMERLGSIAAQSGAPGRVHFVGHVDKSELLRLYNRAKALILPSLYEGYGLPALEAMLCGTPVIVSNITSLPEVVGEAGCLVDPHDVNSIADGIVSVVSNPALRHEMRQKGLARSSQFRWDDVAERTVQVYRQVMTLSPNRNKELPQIKWRTASEVAKRTARAHRHVRLAPALYHKAGFEKGSTRVYAMFNLDSVPKTTTIKRAVLRYHAIRPTSSLRAYPIQSSWDGASVTAGTLPRVSRHRLSGARKVSVKRKSAHDVLLKCNCTDLVRLWQMDPSQNHGVLIKKTPSHRPSLMLTLEG